MGWQKDKGTVILLVGNKADKVAEREVGAEEALLLAGQLNIPFLETSVKLGDNVQEAFLQVAEVVHRSPHLLERAKAKKGEEEGPVQHKGGCCL